MSKIKEFDPTNDYHQKYDHATGGYIEVNKHNKPKASAEKPAHPVKKKVSGPDPVKDKHPNRKPAPRNVYTNSKNKTNGSKEKSTGEKEKSTGKEKDQE